MSVIKMTDIDLKILFFRNRIKQSEIARTVGVSRVTVFRVVNGKERSQRVEVTIANKLGLSPELIWPLEIESTDRKSNPNTSG